MTLPIFGEDEFLGLKDDGDCNKLNGWLPILIFTESDSVYYMFEYQEQINNVLTLMTRDSSRHFMEEHKVT